jgi:hypothetical protein
MEGPGEEIVRQIRKSPAVLLAVAVAVTIGSAQRDDDEEAIRQAVLNYANSAYLVKPELIDESVHPSLQKIGYTRQSVEEGWREHWMNFYELKQLVSGWNKNGRFDPATAKREVKILDRLDRTAAARLDAEWGVDFFHLAKLDGQWKIMNVIWQSYPLQPDAGSETEK